VPVGDGREATVILAKNPAGWTEALRHVSDRARAAVTIAVNARVADGKDPSWLWDVPYEWLAGHPVAAAGERHLDVAVRLRYAELDPVVDDDPVRAARALDAAEAFIIASYTQFSALYRRYGRADGS
jgi:lipid II isoglutaminyl synthase (glutamine-hydrolysing)